MGGMDWEGIGQGAGDVGQQLVLRKEKQTAKRERDEEKATALDNQTRERNYRAAELAWRMVEHLPEGDPQREAAAKNYEAAARAYFKSDSFSIPKKKVGAKPAKTVTIKKPDPRQGEEGSLSRYLNQGTVQEGTPSAEVGLGDTRQRITGTPSIITPPAQEQQTLEVEPAQAGREVYDLPGADTVDEDKVRGAVSQFQTSIANSRSGAARKLALQQAEEWRKAFIAKYPQLAHLVPDFAQTAASFDDEDRRTAAAQVAAKGQAEWQKMYNAAETQFRSALGGTDPTTLIAAIQSRQALRSAGKQAGYLSSGALDAGAEFEETKNLIRYWAAKIADPQKLYAMLPLLAQYNVRPTPQQQKLIDLMLQTKSKAAAPPRGRAPSKGPKKVVEDMDL